MCFMLYLGARVAPPITPHGGKSGICTVHIEVLKQRDSGVRAHFTLPQVVCVASSQGCGCGFRNTSFDQFWPDELYAPFTDPDPGSRQPDHESLAGLLREYFGREAFIELYGCWAGDTLLTELDRRELTLADIRSLSFHLHQRGYCRVTLAGALDAPGKLPEPEAQHRAVVASQESLLGPEHPETLKSRHSLANRLESCGKPAEAEAEHLAVLAVRERVLGLEHPDTLSSRQSVANRLESCGKHAEAEQEYRAVLVSRERLLGSQHPDTLASRHNLVGALYPQGKFAEAEKEHRAILAVQEPLLGPEHPDTLCSRQSVALDLFAQGKFAEAEADFQALLAMRERVLGREHPDTLIDRTNLAAALNAQGKPGVSPGGGPGTTLDNSVTSDGPP